MGTAPRSKRCYLSSTTDGGLEHTRPSSAGEPGAGVVREGFQSDGRYAQEAGCVHANGGTGRCRAASPLQASRVR